MATSSLIQTGLLRACPFAALLVSASAAALPAQATSPGDPAQGTQETQSVTSEAQPTRHVTITYTTHDGHRRNAYVLLPHGYGPGHNPAIPLVISPHGR